MGAVWRIGGGAPLVLLFMAPLGFSLVLALDSLFDGMAWQSLLQHPQLWPALGLSLFTGTLSTIIALGLAILLVAGLHGSRHWRRLASLMGGFLALPHLAFAIGFGILVMPSGFLARLVAQGLTGWSAPPDWVTTQDPAGLALVICLVLKEVPFLVWMMVTILNRDDLQQQFAQQVLAARSLGHGSISIWVHVLLPQILAHMTGPLLAVFAYGTTVVDMALAIGPTQPPTLALVVWADINDGDLVANQRGNAGAIVLALAVGLVAGFFQLCRLALHTTMQRWRTAGPNLGNLSPVPATLFLTLMTLLYGLVLLALVVMSFAGHWPFPDLSPTSFSFHAWQRLVAEPRALWTSLILAAATAASGVTACILWLEATSPALDRVVTPAAMAALVLPGLLVAGGHYQLLLMLGLTGTGSGLYLGHMVPVAGYCFLVLQGPYRAFDPRWRTMAKSLGRGSAAFWWQIKLPLLKAPILACLAVGFAVSLAQYIISQLAGAGRFTTLPIEAVTLAAGGNRPLTAVFALAQMVPPLLGFITVAYLGRPRWRLA